MKKTIMLICIILVLIGCGESKEKAKTPQQQLEEDAGVFFKFTEDTIIKPIIQPDGTYNLEILYPVKDFDINVGITPIVNNFASVLENFYSTERNVENITIELRDGTVDGKKIGVFKISKREFIELKKQHPNVYKYIGKFMKLNEKLLVELNMRSFAKTAQDFKIERYYNETTNITTINVSFSIKRQENPLSSTPLTSISSFEDLITNVVKTTFETDSSIGEVIIEVDLANLDPRWNETTRVADFTITRDEFTQILEKWDNLKYKIYDKIHYTPIFFGDFISKSKIINMTYGDKISMNLYYEDDFENIDKTIAIVEEDASNLIVKMFKRYPSVQEIDLNFKVKVPAEEGEVSSDGIHFIENGFLIVHADRNTFESLNTEELNPKQIIYNFNPIYNDKANKLNIESNLFSKTNYFRKIDVSGTDATIEIDSCLFLKDDFFGPRINAVKGIINQGLEANLEEEIRKITFEAAKKLIFELHPPYLETVTFDLKEVYRDTTGNEINVVDLGTISFEKEDKANYWFQTEDPSSLEWVIETDDNLDIDNSQILCQT